MFYQANRGPDSPVKTIYDFLPYVDRPPEKRQTPEEMMAVMRGWAGVLAGAAR